MNKLILNYRSFCFSLLVVSLCRQLRNEKKEYVLSDQLLRSATAVGAIIREAEYDQSGADFIRNMNIALKAANETEYWLDLLKDSGFLDYEKHHVLTNALNEIVRMLISTIIVAKESQ